MPTTPKLGSTASCAEAESLLQSRLVRGIAALKTALASLPLLPTQQAFLKRVLAEQVKALRKIQAPTDRSKTVRIEKARNPQARVQPQVKSRKELELEREAVHRKSGYSSQLRRLPGSFESGKK